MWIVVQGFSLPVIASSLPCLLLGGALLSPFSTALAADEVEPRGALDSAASEPVALGNGPQLPGSGNRLDEEGIVLAQATTETDAGTQTGDLRAVPSPAIDNQSSESAARAEKGGPGSGGAKRPSRWGIAPIRWGLTLSDSLRWSRSDEGQSGIQHLQQAQFRANSYLWQPWFAQVSGSLGLISGVDRSKSLEGATDSRNRQTSVVGGALINLFPVSRFPFVGQLEVSDSRTSTDLTDSNYRSTRLSLRQTYRNLKGDVSANASFDHSRLNGDFGSDTVNAVSLGFSRAFEKQSIAGDFSYARNSRSDDVGSASYLRASARHTYRSSAALGIDSNVSYNDSDQRFSGGAGSLGSGLGRFRFLQATSFATWTPENSRWRGTGTARVFQADTSSGGDGGNSRSLSLNGSASYLLNRNATLYGGLGINLVRTDADSSVLTTQTLGANYNGDVLDFGKYSYNWYASANLANQSGGQEGAVRTLNLSIGHGLNRSWDLSPTSGVSANLGQTISATQTSQFGSGRGISHNAGVSWRGYPGESLSTYVSLSAADSRNSGDNANSFQLINFQANGQWQLSRYSSASADFTWQHTKQSSNLRRTQRERTSDPIDDTESKGSGSAAGGNLTYVHARALGVRGLRYSLLFNANSSRTVSDTRQEGNPDAGRDLVTKSLEQRLDYRIGRLDLRLSTRVAEIDGKKNALVLVRISRDFGPK
ncbi:MAG: hypothetical protein IPL03_00415 [Sterolibacteriaceae bacterium]|nr:hypothetical protein [Candidatus Methylophosphatis haderslevensis]